MTEVLGWVLSLILSLVCSFYWRVKSRYSRALYLIYHTIFEVMLYFSGTRISVLHELQTEKQEMKTYLHKSRCEECVWGCESDWPYSDYTSVCVYCMC